MHHSVLSQHGGVARSSLLIEHGLSRYFLNREVTEGRLVRIRKGWVAWPNADPALVAAAKQGLTISCITQAARLGLWVRDSSTSHYAVPRPGGQSQPTGAVLHYHAALTPRHRFALADTIENTLNLVAQCQPFEDAVATWDSALNKRLVDRTALLQLPLNAAARRVLEATDPFADSGLETYFRLRLRWLRIGIVSQAWISGHRVDFLLGDRLVVQIDGAHHTGAQRTKDITHDAELRLRGFTVIRLSYTQLMDSWPNTQARIMRAIAHGLHEKAELQ